MGLISNGTTLLDAGSISAAKGALTHIKTLTASSSSDLTFLHGSASVVLDGTYKEYIFKFYDIHPSANSMLSVNFRDGGTNYDATKTSTFFEAYQNEAGTSTSLAYVTDYDLAQSTAVQRLGYVGTENDESLAGTMHLFDPASTTFVKHFMSEIHGYHSSDLAINTFVSGYCNVTAAIDGVQFTMASGNIDAGTIKLYGVS
tara:strand:+ start:372 stop:974 length:603 start_codon:yes stop_codon:yes gene_type:complete